MKNFLSIAFDIFIGHSDLFPGYVMMDEMGKNGRAYKVIDVAFGLN